MSKSLGKRILAITLSVLMVMTLLPTGMFADDSVEVTADNYQELLNVPLSVNAYMQDHVSWGWKGNGWNSTTLGGTVSIDEDWFGDTYDSILTSDNTDEWTTYPSFCISITDGGYLTESDKEVGYTGEAHTYNFTYSDIVIAATGYNDVVIRGATVETVFQYVQYSGYYGGTSYDIDLLTPIMEQTGLTTLQQVAEEYIPAIYNVKFSATLNSFDGVSYSDIQEFIATLDEGGSGETGDTGDTGEYDLSGYTLSYSADINLAASNLSWYTFSDTAIVDAMATEGSKFVVTRSTSVTETNYDKFGLVDEWFSMSMDWLNLGTAISKAADETGIATVIDCEFDNGVTVVYDGTTIYNALVAAGFYNGGAAQFISNTSSQTYTITNVSVYVPTTTSTSTVLPWELTSTDYVNDWNEMTFYQTAINGFTYGDYQWSTLIQNNSSSNYSGSLALWDGFIEALLSDNAVFEITSTSANTHIILQAGANFGYGLGVYVYADSVVDNGDGTYTTTISCASALSAFASATQEGYEGSPAVPTSTSDYGDLFGLVISSSDESATLLSFKIVESTASSGGDSGDEDEPIEVYEFPIDIEGYSTISYAEMTEGGTITIFDGVDFTDNSLYLAIVYEGIDSSSEYYGYGAGSICTNSWASVIGYNEAVPDAYKQLVNIDENGYILIPLTTIAEAFEASVSDAPEDGVVLNWWGNGWGATLYGVELLSKDITTDDILAANQEMIDNLTALLLSYNDVVYINQSDAEDFNGYFSAGWSEVCASSWDWDEIASVWTTSLGDEATVAIGYSDYVAPVAGTLGDLDGTDGSITMTYYADVGDPEAGTYVASQTYTVTIVIKATQLYHVDIPEDTEGRFTVTTSADYAYEGDEVTITIETAEGYKVSEVRAWYQDDDGNTNSLGITYYEDTGVWSITMPAYDIWVAITVGTLDVNYAYDSDAVYLVDGVTSANEGDEIIFYVFVNRGYELDGEITAVDENGNTVTLTEVYSGLSVMNYKPSTAYAYSFTMPESSVTITATSFKAIDGFIDGAFYITDCDEISFIDQVDFTDSDTYLVISYDLMFESDENVDNYGDWSPGGIFAVSDTGEWIQLCEISSYYSSNGTFAISLADIAALASDAGCNIDTYGVIIVWWVYDDEYASNETFTLVSADYAVNTEVVGSGVSGNGADVFVEGLPNEGSTITVTITPDAGYALGSVVATDANGNEIELTVTDCGIHKYTFTMPDADVTVEATLIPESELSEIASWYGYGYVYNLSEDGILDNEYTDYGNEALYLCFNYDYNTFDDYYLGSIGYGVGGYWDQLCNIPAYECGHTYISLSELAAAAAELGYVGEYYFYIGGIDTDSMVYTIVTSEDLLEVNVEECEGITSVDVNGYRKEGKTITFFVDVAEGYIIKSFTATDAEGDEVELTRNYMTMDDACYTFTMPATDVTLKAETVLQSDLTTIVTETTGTDWIYVWNFGSPIFYNQYVDFTDENLYLTINYEAKDDHEGETVAVVAYGDENYDYDSTVYQDVVRLMDNGTGTVSVSLTDIQAAVEATGLTSGYYYLWSYDGEYSISSISIDTLDTYTAEESSVGETVTIDGVEYEITWDTTTTNPTAIWYENNNVIGWSTCLYTDWWTISQSFKGAVVSHLDDSSLILVEAEEDFDSLGVWLQLVEDYHIVYTGVTINGNTAYIRLDDIAEYAANDGYEVTADNINSLLVGDFETMTSGITAVRILTPLTYEVDSVTWAADYSSATVKLVAGTHTQYVTVTDVTSDTTNATCTADGSTDYTAIAAYNGQTFEVSTTVTIPAIGHTEAEAVEENRVEANCTEDGSYDSVVYCSDCGEELSRETVTIPATGHSYVAVVTDPTCTEDGYTTYTCSACGDSYVADETEATGHDYGEPEWTWDGYTSATATFTCENDSTHVEVVTAEITSATTDATCEDDGETVYTASVTFNGETYTTTATEVLSATDHDWTVSYEWSEDGTTCTATHVCANDAEHNVSETVTTEGAVTVQPTCTEKGTTTYTATFTSDWAETKTMDVVDVEALGHTEGEAVEENRVGATCETDGSYDTVVYCSVCGAELSRETTTIPAIGHNYGEPEWTWDGYTSATATFTCGNDSTHVEVVTAEITSATTAATCEEDGETVYTASVTFEGNEYTSIETEVLTAIGHEWTVSYEWSEDGKTCTATHICGRDSAHNESETVTTSGTETVAPTCTEKGTTTYTATFTSDWAGTKTMDVVDVEALGHDWSVEYTWSTDGKSCTATHVCGRDSTHNESETVTTSGTETVAPTCTEKGTTTYTATFDADWAQTQTLDVQDIDALGHTYSDPEFTWDEEAYTATATFNCTVDGCDGSYTTKADVASNTTAAGCTVDGKTVYTAVVVFNETEYTDTYEVVIPATGHTTEIRNAKDATCTEDGYTGDEVCTVCGETITVGTVIPAIGHSFDSNGVCTTCGAKTGTESTSSSVTVSSGDTIFAEVLSSGLVTSVEVTVSNDNSGAVIISEVVEGTAEPHLVGHIAVDALNFTLYNSSQEDDLISNTSSFNITTTKENKTVIEKVSVLFYGDVDYNGQGTSAVTMKFTGSDLSESTIYVLHYTGTYPEWETVTHTVTTSGTTTTIEFETDSFSPYVVLSVANMSSSDSNSTVLDLLLRISADYSSVNEAIARANALNPSDYENFSAVTEAINAVNWNLKAINQLTVNAYADAINTAIDNLVEATANITEETVEIIDPIEGTDTDTEEDDESPETSEPETNPTTGIAFSILPMVTAALVAVSAKRR